MYFLQSFIVLILLSITLYLTLSSVLNVLLMIKTGSKKKINNLFFERCFSVFQMIFFGKKILDERSYGIMHFCYFYGFLILSIGHLELLLFGLTSLLKGFNKNPFLYSNFLPSYFVNIYEFSQDIMALGVIIAVIIALYNRLSGRILRLKKRSKDAEIILWFICALYITFFLLTSSETIIKMNNNELQSTWHWFIPVTSLLSVIFIDFSSFFSILHPIVWWLHLLIFLGFSIYVPRSKHLHLIAAGPNIYFRNFDSIGKPSSINFDIDERFGVNKVTDLSWKTLLDSFSCTECGRCDAVCPASLTGKPLRPKKILNDIKINLRLNNIEKIKNNTSEEKINELNDFKKNLINRKKCDGLSEINGQISLDELWSCTTCAACIDICPVLIDSVPTSIIEMRRNLVLTEASDYPKEVNTAFKGLENNSNPWGVGKSKRIDWIMDLDVPILGAENGKKYEYLFYVGCAGSTDDRSRKIQRTLVKILKKYNISFAILGEEERCCGDPARRIGNEYLYDILAKENIKILKKYNISKIFTACPHCFNQLKNEYKDYGLKISIQHHSELISELFNSGKIHVDDSNKIKKTITFHDPCYLGRYNNQYNAPRNSLLSSKNFNIKEMEMSKRKSFCCGAGGGRMFMEENIGVRINSSRVDQAISTGAKIIATACPFCMIMINDAIKDKGLEEGIKVKDISELVFEEIS